MPSDPSLALAAHAYRQAHDLRTAFPVIEGSSPRYLKYMRALAEAWPESQFVQQAAAQLPRYHQLALLAKAGSACSSEVEALSG